MSRLNIQGDTVADVEIGGKHKIQFLSQTLGATLVVAADFPPLLILDPGGSARNVDMPAVALVKGQTFTIINSADAAEAITVRDAAAATIIAIGQNEIGWIFCDGVSWFGVSMVA